MSDPRQPGGAPKLSGTSARQSGWQLPPQGSAWLLTATLLLGLGTFKNIHLLTFLGCVLLAVLALNVPAAWLRLRGLTGRRRLPEFLIAGEFCSVKITIKREGLAPGPGVAFGKGWGSGIWIEDHGPAHVRSWSWSARPEAAEQIWQGPVLLPRRGRQYWGPLVATSSHPFGLFRLRGVLARGEEVVVLPRLGKVHRGLLRRYLRGTDPRAEHRPRHTLRSRAAQAEFHGLREFHTGDSPRWIHWRTSARRGQLMVREFEDLPGDDLAVVLDPGGYVPGELFEAVVSLAATLCWEWCGHKGDRLSLAIAGPEPVVLGGLTGPELALETLTALAFVVAGEAGEARESGLDGQATLVERLAAVTPPSAGVLLLCRRRSALAGALRRKLERPVAVFDSLDDLDYYTPPAGSLSKVGEPSSRGR